MIEHLIPEWRKNHKIRLWAPVGSRVTCDPAPTDTDADYLFLMEEKEFAGNAVQLFREELEHFGWVIGGSMPLDVDEGVYPPETQFTSFTRGEDNLLITESPLFFNRFLAATAVAKRLNLLSKFDRIALFQAVLYANTTEPVPVRCPAMEDVQAKSADRNWEKELEDLI